MAQNFIKSFFIRSGILLAACVAVIVIFDPFFQYHKPLPGLKAVLTEKEYQVAGSLRNFDYDSVILGSSVAENYDNSWFNQSFGCTTIKAIRSYGAPADLCYLLDIALAGRELKYVFYNMDTASLDADPVVTTELADTLAYLYDRNFLNDIDYLINKDVLMEKVPFLLANSFIGDYDENNSFNWAQWKSFSQELVLTNYLRRPSVAAMLEETAYQEQLTGNLAFLTEQIGQHPETVFKIFFPPYSMLYWDNIYRNGKTEAYFYNMEQAIGALLAYENVEIYYYQSEEAIVCDLNHYMDVVHFSKEVNHWIYEQLAAGNGRLTQDNYMAVLADMRRLVERIVTEDVLPLESLMKYDASDGGYRLF